MCLFTQWTLKGNYRGLQIIKPILICVYNIILVELVFYRYNMPIYTVGIHTYDILLM